MRFHLDGESDYRTFAQSDLGGDSVSPENGLSGLRDLRNSATLAELPAVASLLTRYRLFELQFKFLSRKDDV
jgi:hypothetical protein